MRTRPVALLALGLSILAGCRSRPSGTLVVAQDGGIISLDPHRQDEAVTVSVLSNIYEGLVGFDANLKVVPMLAEGYSNPDDLTWRFYLRKRVRFHDGRELTSMDAYYSLRRAWQDSLSVFQGMLSGIQEIRTVDRSTVDIVTKRPQLTLIKVLTQVAIMPDGFVPGTAAVGTGPYRFTGFLTDQGVRVERFAQYWGQLPEFAVVEFRCIIDEQRRAAALIKGTVDVDASVSEGQRKGLEGNSDIALQIWPSSSIGLLCFNMKGRPADNPLADRRVRQALSLAIDRQQLVDEAYFGYAEPANQLIPSTTVGYEPALPQIERDVRKARKLLKQAGCPESLHLRLEMSSAAWLVGQVLRRQLREVGIVLQVDTVDWETLYRTMDSGSSNFYLMGFSFGYGDASEMLNELHSYQAGELGNNNISGYSNPAMDRLIQQAEQEFDPAQRSATLKRATALAMEDLPYIPLYFRENCYGLRRSLRWQPRTDGLVLAREFSLSR